VFLSCVEPVERLGDRRVSDEDAMAEIINLNRARKAREKADRTARAAANRAAHGRTKAERQGTEAERTRAAALLDGHRRETEEKE
jgi:hypothetical protein